jgi:hypothetical protein
MTNNYGIKVSRPGFDVKTAAPNELSFSSEYKTLKVHTSGSGAITDSTRLITIPHNLGYVPLFMVHSTMNAGFGGNLFSSGDYVLTPAGLGGILTNPSAGINDDLFAYADTTNLYIKAQSNFGKLINDEGSQTDGQFMAWESSISGYFSGLWAVGNNGGETWKGAYRFENLLLNQATTIYSAKLNLYVSARDGSSNILLRVFGIDEDDTVAFDTNGAATARPKTTAFTDNTSNISAGSGFNIDVTSSVQEVINRSGWASGNHLGFIIDDNGTSATNDYTNNSHPENVSLEIIINSTIANYKYTIFKNQLE